VAARRRKRGHAEEEHADERWLLTYADMITLLMALFLVLFAMSSVNAEKFESLQRSLQAAFSGAVLPGGQTIKQTGGEPSAEAVAATPPNVSLGDALVQARSGDPKREQADLERLREQIDATATGEGLRGKVQTRLDERGLTVVVLSDDLLFASASAALEPRSAPLLRKLGRLLLADVTHPIEVRGHTDDRPIRGGRFPSNWELGGDRAAAVVRAFARENVAPARMSATTRSYLDPVATNATARGRAKNRRVEIVIPRMDAGA
jgi:chemotaxis protein MotB